MKRTAEKILSITSLVFNGIGIVFSFIMLVIFKSLISDSVEWSQFEMDLLSDPAITSQEIEMLYVMIDLFTGVGWFFIFGFIVSLIMTVIGIVGIWKNKKPKLAGITFILAGLFAGILSPTSILLYIAGILCLVRKPPLIDSPITSENHYEDGMRPL